MATTWEYAWLAFTRDPGADVSVIHAWLATSADPVFRDLGEKVIIAAVSELGSEGWEMVGNPSQQNSVFSYKAGNDTWHDRAYWLELTFWFKRLVSA